MTTTQSDIIQAVITQALEKPGQYVSQTVCGPHMVAVRNEFNTGLCSRLRCRNKQGNFSPSCSDSLRTLIKDLEYQNSIKASWGLAAINSLLNRGADGPEIKIQQLIHSLGRGKNVAIIGHFPFVENMGKDFRNFWVLEISPKESDIPEYMKVNILPRADLVAITATTLLNGSLGEILSLIPGKAVRMMLGPSTPLAPCLLDMGIDYLGGALVADHEKVFPGIKNGIPFRRLNGVGYTTLGKYPV